MSPLGEGIASLCFLAGLTKCNQAICLSTVSSNPLWWPVCGLKIDFKEPTAPITRRVHARSNAPCTRDDSE
uniref:Putative secreted protein n=1 Tax=Anopheles darlingi TaxID=43151 RepID=A0A2M4D0L7_ANODA